MLAGVGLVVAAMSVVMTFCGVIIKKIVRRPVLQLKMQNLGAVYY